jgi:excisionase family DNA binding protein
MRATRAAKKRIANSEGFDGKCGRGFRELLENQIPCEAVWLTTVEAAAYLKLSVGCLYNLASQGTLPYHKLGRRNRFLKIELDLHLMREQRGRS